jgi:hypothetical protein
MEQYAVKLTKITRFIRSLKISLFLIYELIANIFGCIEVLECTNSLTSLNAIGAIENRSYFKGYLQKWDPHRLETGNRNKKSGRWDIMSSICRQSVITIALTV